MAGQERTESATPRRRLEARERGQVARSMDLSGAVGAFGGLAVLAVYTPTLYAHLGQLLREHLGQLARTDLTRAEAVSLGLATMVTVLVALAPIAGGLLLLGVAANLLQVGFLVTAYPLRPDLTRLDPLRGLGRLFSGAGALEIAKAGAKSTVIGYLGYRSLEANQGVLLTLAQQELRAGVEALARLGLDLALQMATAALALALIDYGIQRFRHERNLRMTRHEVQEELKQSEGDPRLKGRLRELRHRLASRRMMQAVPHADVVVTNPTHLAIALRYDAQSMRSPHVVAKGAALTAERIKEVARQHQVPMIENRPLAQALFRTTEVGMEVPTALYQAVAETLAFVYSLKEARRGR